VVRVADTDAFDIQPHCSKCGKRHYFKEQHGAWWEPTCECDAAYCECDHPLGRKIKDCVKAPPPG
jgi:hypothetical protein